MLCRATQDEQVTVESSDKMWSTGERNGQPLEHAWLENPINSCCSSVTQLCPTLGDTMDCSTPVLHISWNLLKLMSIESVMPSNHLVLCCPLLLLPSIFPSIRVFSNESDLCIRQPKYWSFGFSINTSNEYSGLISFRIDWFYFLAVQGTLKSFVQHHISKHPFFGTQTSLWFNSHIHTWLLEKS